MSALETAETARGAIEKDRRRLLDSWLVRGIALAMLLMQAAALYLGARGR